MNCRTFSQNPRMRRKSHHLSTFQDGQLITCVEVVMQVNQTFRGGQLYATFFEVFIWQVKDVLGASLVHKHVLSALVVHYSFEGRQLTRTRRFLGGQLHGTFCCQGDFVPKRFRGGQLYTTRFKAISWHIQHVFGWLIAYNTLSSCSCVARVSKGSVVNNNFLKAVSFPR